MKKLFAVLLTLTLVLSMGTIALAADTGSITISNAVVGEEYTIYKMFDFTPIEGSTTQGRYSYASDAWETFVETEAAAYLAFDAETGTINWVGTKDADGNADATEVAALAKLAVAYAVDNGISGTTIEADSETVTFSDLALGYYAIDTTLGTICALTNTNSTETVFEKNEQPTIEKKIVEDTLVDANNVAIGDTVDYQIIVKATAGTVNYVIHDTMSDALTFDSATVVVKNGDAVLTAGTDYELAVPGACGCTFEIDLTDEYELNTLKADDVITVTYSATLNDNANIGNIGNANEVYLAYGKAQETTKDIVITYTTELTIDKVDGDDKALTGAGFTLYKWETAESDWVAVGEEVKGETLTTFVWTGLEEGKYKLVETTVPEGFNKAADIEFTITCTEPETVAAATDAAAWTDDNDSITAEDDGTFYGKVENKTGTLLPETGGIGTTIFYVVGGLLMAAAFILLVSKKRMANFA